MPFDQQGNRLSGASPTAIEHYQRALTSFNLYRGDPFVPLEDAIAEAPGFAMAHILKAYLYATSTEPAANIAAQKILVSTQVLPLSEQEASHVAVLKSLTGGNWTEAALALDYHSNRFPHDLVAIQCGHLMDFYRANSRNLRDRIARVMPQWSAEIPGYSLLLGMYAFGLEECADYERAEAYGNSALELEPFDCWAHHAVAHVLEMQGRPAEGVTWMQSREPFWAEEDNFFKVHNWWHRALYHLDLGETEKALEIYDGPIRRDASVMALDLVDAAALLWRLTLAGCDPGERWQELANCWDPLADGHHYPFNDWHGAMAFLGAGRQQALERVGNCLRAGRDSHREVCRWGWETGLPLVEGFTAFWEGDYGSALHHLHSARYIANSFGGSHAQRDIIDWTLAEAAIRSGDRSTAEAFTEERLALKPNSAIVKEMVARASRPV